VLDALTHVLAARGDEGARAVLPLADGFLHAFVALEALTSPRVLEKLSEPGSVLDLMSDAFTRADDSPRSADRSQGLRVLRLGLPRQILRAAVRFSEDARLAQGAPRLSATGDPGGDRRDHPRAAQDRGRGRGRTACASSTRAARSPLGIRAASSRAPASAAAGVSLALVTEASAPAPAKKKSGFRLWPLLSGLVLAGALIGGLAYLVLSFKLYKVPQNGMFPHHRRGGDPGRAAKAVRKRQRRPARRHRRLHRQAGRQGRGLHLAGPRPARRGGRPDRTTSSRSTASASRARALRKDGREKVIYQEEFRGKSWSVALPEPANDWTKANMTPKKLGRLGAVLARRQPPRRAGLPLQRPRPRFSTVVAKIVYP
jgi:hypothetical protein